MLKSVHFSFLRNSLLGDKSAVEALIVQFYQWEEYARLAEKRTNAILDGEKDEGGTTQHKSNEEFIEETVAKCRQRIQYHT